MKRLRTPWNHLAVLLLLQFVAFAAYWRVLRLPLWNELDFAILYDAHVLSGNLPLFLSHIGTAFSQPVLQLGFLWQYTAFGVVPQGYLTVNVVLHALNAFIVYMLVNMLFPRERMARLASLLFVAAVGHYSKTLLNLAGQEHIVLGSLYMLVLYCLIRNDLRHHGRLRSTWFTAALLLFIVSGLTRPASFSLIGSLLAYKFFFNKERGGRAIFSPDLLILLVVGTGFYVAQQLWGFRRPGIGFEGGGNAFAVTFESFKTIFRYLNLMVFPLQVTDMIRSSHPAIQFVYDWRVVFRTIISLSIVSFGFFGVLFGNRALRFFIAWTIITVLPFTGAGAGSDWLNVQYLYLSSVGFCVILASGTMGCSRLLARHRVKRWLPYLAPLFFMLTALSVNDRLIRRDEGQARSPRVQELHRLLDESLRMDPPTPGNGQNPLQSP